MNQVAERLDPELEALGEELRGARPQTPPATRERLDQRLLSDAGREHKHRSWLSGPAAAISGGLAALLVAAVVIIPGSGSTGVAGGGSRGEENKATGEGAYAAPDTSASSSATEPSIAVPPGSGEPVPLPYPIPSGEPDLSVKERKVERSAALSLISEDVAGVATKAIRVIDGLEGVVLSAHVTSGEGPDDSILVPEPRSDEVPSPSPGPGPSGDYAYLDLRVPSERLDAALAQLTQLGEVTSRSQGQIDITTQFDPLTELLEELKAARISVLAELEQAHEAAERSGLRGELERIQAERDSVAAQLSALEGRANSSAISLQIMNEAPKAAEEEGFGPAVAVEWISGTLRPLAGVGVLLLVPLIPLGCWWLIRRQRTRARERTISGS